MLRKLWNHPCVAEVEGKVLSMLSRTLKGGSKDCPSREVSAWRRWQFSSGKVADVSDPLLPDTVEIVQVLVSRRLAVSRVQA